MAILISRCIFMLVKPKDMLKLVLTALLEPIFYHPITVWAAVKGNYDLLAGKKSWGVMVRTGFGKKAEKTKASKIKVAA